MPQFCKGTASQVLYWCLLCHRLLKGQHHKNSGDAYCAAIFKWQRPKIFTGKFDWRHKYDCKNVKHLKQMFCVQTKCSLMKSSSYLQYCVHQDGNELLGKCNLAQRSHLWSSVKDRTLINSYDLNCCLQMSCIWNMNPVSRNMIPFSRNMTPVSRNMIPVSRNILVTFRSL